MQKIIKISVQIVCAVALTAVCAFAGPPARPGSTPSASEIKAAMDKAPKAVFPQLKYTFAPVFEGLEIKHDFVVENQGAAPLVIKSIRPD
jgi:hypothetical protein